LRDEGVDTAVTELGVQDGFPAHASREEILAEAGLTADRVASDVAEQVRGSRIPIARPEEPREGTE
ncbi:1-deoxy-D-xylulose-5-phosphate synthase, partial [Leucobacter sp. M11]|nr:1-deoxy-D-xylulose-5-phosphate synthase [Leucobacter sp. M11]